MAFTISPFTIDMYEEVFTLWKQTGWHLFPRFKRPGFSEIARKIFNLKTFWGKDLILMSSIALKTFVKSAGCQYKKDFGI